MNKGPSWLERGGLVLLAALLASGVFFLLSAAMLSLVESGRPSDLLFTLGLVAAAAGLGFAAFKTLMRIFRRA